jgi:hypothetical protein
VILLPAQEHNSWNGRLSRTLFPRNDHVWLEQHAFWAHALREKSVDSGVENGASYLFATLNRL